MKTNHYKKVLNFIYLFPFLLLIGAFLVYPCIQMLVISLKVDYSRVTGEFSAIGINNYIDLFNDENFIKAIVTTLKLLVFSVPISLVISFFAANILLSVRHGAIFQSALILPFLTSSTAIGYAWRYIFNTKSGIVNFVLNGVIHKTPNWLYSNKYSFWLLCIFLIWKLIPFTTIMICTSIQSFDRRLVDMAKIDNASKWLIFKKIYIPHMRPMLIILTLLNSVSALKTFDELFPLFLGKPGPYYNLYTIVYYVFEQAQGANRYGFGKAAAASVLLVVPIIIIMLSINFLRKHLSR